MKEFCFVSKRLQNIFHLKNQKFTKMYEYITIVVSAVVVYHLKYL